MVESTPPRETLDLSELVETSAPEADGETFQLESSTLLDVMAFEEGGSSSSSRTRRPDPDGEPNPDGVSAASGR